MLQNCKHFLYASDQMPIRKMLRFNQLLSKTLHFPFIFLVLTTKMYPILYFIVKFSDFIWGSGLPSVSSQNIKIPKHLKKINAYTSI